MCEINRFEKEYKREGRMKVHAGERKRGSAGL
jgi:hypothetical protein